MYLPRRGIASCSKLHRARGEKKKEIKEMTSRDLLALHLGINCAAIHHEGVDNFSRFNESVEQHTDIARFVSPTQICTARSYVFVSRIFFLFFLSPTSHSARPKVLLPRLILSFLMI